MFGVLKRFWILLVLSMVMLTGGWAVVRVRDTFAFDGVVPSGELNASINFLDENGQPNLVDQARLPWEYTIVTTLPSCPRSSSRSETGSCRREANPLSGSPADSNWRKN